MFLFQIHNALSLLTKGLTPQISVKSFDVRLINAEVLQIDCHFHVVLLFNNLGQINELITVLLNHNKLGLFVILDGRLVNLTKFIFVIFLIIFDYWLYCS